MDSLEPHRPLRLALIGIDRETLDVVRWLSRTALHELSVLLPDALPDPDCDEVRRLFPAVETDWAWESLLGTQQIDAVLVARSSNQELRDDQLRKLSQSGMPLMVSHPGCSAIVAFELDMIRTDVGGAIIPLFSARMHPALGQLRNWIDAGGPLGTILRLDIESPFEPSDPGVVERQLARGAYLASQLIGPIVSVNAVSSIHESQQFEHASVHLFGEGALAARWTASRSSSNSDRIQLVGQDGEATLEMCANASEWILKINDGSIQDKTYTAWSSAAAAFEELERSMAGNHHEVAWQDACRDLEIAETAKQSLRRRRAMDVYSEPRTEEDSFKGVMAAGSCGLLLLVLFGFLLLAVIEGFRMPLVDLENSDTGPRWPLFLRLWPVYPLFGFLALQFLIMVARRKQKG